MWQRKRNFGMKLVQKSKRCQVFCSGVQTVTDHTHQSKYRQSPITCTSRSTDSHRPHAPVGVQTVTDHMHQLEYRQSPTTHTSQSTDSHRPHAPVKIQTVTDHMHQSEAWLLFTRQPQRDGRLKVQENDEELNSTSNHEHHLNVTKTFFNVCIHLKTTYQRRR